MKCPKCGAELVIEDSFDILDYSKLFTDSYRLDEYGRPVAIANKEVPNGNLTTYKCKNCGISIQSKRIENKIETIKER